jgi:hypothetical protein
MTGPAGLRRFVPGAAPAERPATAAAAPPAAPAEERCELCAAAIPTGHGHIADLESAKLLCACRACYLLFTHPGAGLGGNSTGRGRYRADPDRPMSASEWEELQVPVGLAFFLHSSRNGEVTGFYPSPAGATESRLDLAAWDRLAAAHPLLRAMEPDVEAALICHTDGTVEHYLVPIDACYELAGRMRLHWRGFDGGAGARQAIDEFLGRVRARARPRQPQSS